MERIPARPEISVPAARIATTRIMIASVLIGGEIILPLVLSNHDGFVVK
jgi:hypothetical protein